MKNEVTQKQIKKILETPFWLETLSTDKNYQRTHDDHDGEWEGKILVTVDEQGDVWFQCDRAYRFLRFRNYMGGGASLRTRNALLILAEAIRLDNEERPERPPK